MPATTSTSMVSVDCECGNRLWIKAGGFTPMIECPICRRRHTVSSSQPSDIGSTDSTGLSRNTLLALWTCVGVAALLSLAFMYYHSRATHSASVTRANEQLANATLVAQSWIESGEPGDGDAVERDLAEALSGDLVTNTDSGRDVLLRLQQRRSEVASNQQRKLAQQRAATILETAKQQILAKQTIDAIATLRDYIANPEAIERADAKRLLEDAEAATSAPIAINRLVEMDEGSFQAFVTTGILNGGSTHPILKELQVALMRSQVSAATAQRKLLAQRRAKQQQLEETSRLARANAQQREHNLNQLKSRGLTILYGHGTDFDPYLKRSDANLVSVGRSFPSGEKHGLWISVMDGELWTTTEFFQGRRNGIQIIYTKNKPTYIFQNNGGVSHGWDLAILPNKTIASRWVYGKPMIATDPSYESPPEDVLALMLTAQKDHLARAAEILPFVTEFNRP